MLDWKQAVKTMSIKNILREEDIEGLIKLGAPADEYNSEAKEIEAAMSRLGDNPSEEQVVQVLKDIWKDSFDLSTEDIELRRDTFQRVARRILLDPWQRNATP
jgi:hypothetical protein